MKKLISFFSLILFLSCSTTSNEEEQLDENLLLDNVIRIEVLTGEPNTDELFVTYYQYQTDTYNWQPYQFNYDAQGNPEPVVITIEDYDFRYIQGEVYRTH